MGDGIGNLIVTGMIYNVVHQSVQSDYNCMPININYSDKQVYRFAY